VVYGSLPPETRTKQVLYFFGIFYDAIIQW
jgi:hypothetical protein